MKLYFIRHGITDDHLNDVRQTPDSPLGKMGKKQAEKVAARLKEVKIDHLYSSDWPRAKQTAEEIAKQMELPLKTEAMFREAAKSKHLD